MRYLRAVSFLVAMLLRSQFLRSTFVFACLFVAALAPAQLSRWQLGNPSLILDLPGDPGGGGVLWHERDIYGVLVSSWSSESADARVEVATYYTSETPQALANKVAAKLGATATGGQAGKVSGQDAYGFSVGNRSGLAISGGGKGWVILATPKSGNAPTVIREIMTSVIVERAGSPRWVRRSLGGTKMHAELPFDLADDTSGRGNERRRSFELHWNDIAVSAFVESAGQDMRIDLEGSIKTYIDGESKLPGTQDFKSKRQKYKLDRLSGEVVTLDLKQGTKVYRKRAFFALDSGQMLRMTITTRPDRADHETSAERIWGSFKVSGVNFNGFESRQIGSEPLFIDLQKAPESKGNGVYSSFMGAYGVDIRVTPINPSTGHNEDQLAMMLSAKYQGRPDVKDFKVETTRRLIDGLEARMVRASYKGKVEGFGRTNEVGLAIFTADAIYVVEAIVGDNEIEYLERIFDSVRYEARPPAGWNRRQIGDAGFSLFWSGDAKADVRPGTTPDMLSTSTFAINQDAFLGTVVEMKFKSAPPQPGLLLPVFAKALAEGMKAEYKILEQRPIDIGDASGITAKLSFNIGGVNRPGDMIVLRKGDFIWTLVIAYDPAKGTSIYRQALVTSLR